MIRGVMSPTNGATVRAIPARWLDGAWLDGGIQPNIIRQIGRVIAFLRQRGDLAIILVKQYFDFAHDPGDGFHVLKRGAVSLRQTLSA